MSGKKIGIIAIVVLAAVAWFGGVQLSKRWSRPAQEQTPAEPQAGAEAKSEAPAQPEAPKAPAPPPVEVVKIPTAKDAKKVAAAPKPPAGPSSATIAGGTPAPKPAAPPSESAPGETLQQAQAMLAKGGVEKENAWSVLTRKYLAAASEPEREEVRKVLEETAKDLMFSKTPTSFAEIYVVQRGDTLYDIARKYETTIGLIMWASEKARPTIRPGDRLKIPRGKVKLILQKSRFRLIVLFNNNYVKEYAVAIGHSDKTPTGAFIIDEKVENPDWYAPDGKVHKFGSKENILGTRWLRFKETSQYAGFGIHGTSEPDTIGKPASAGCIRMLNGEVEELFSVVPRGTEVVIRE